MKLLPLAALAVRVLGIYLFIKTVSTVPFEIKHIIDSPKNNFLTAYLFYNGLIFVVSMIFILFPKSAAKLLIPIESDSSTEAQIDYQKLEACAFAILGMYVLSYAVPDLFYNAIFLMKVFVLQDQDWSDYSKQFTVNFIVTCIEIVIGLVLLLGTKGLIRLITKFRG